MRIEGPLYTVVTRYQTPKAEIVHCYGLYNDQPNARTALRKVRKAAGENADLDIKVVKVLPLLEITGK